MRALTEAEMRAVMREHAAVFLSFLDLPGWPNRAVYDEMTSIAVRDTGLIASVLSRAMERAPADIAKWPLGYRMIAAIRMTNLTFKAFSPDQLEGIFLDEMTRLAFGEIEPEIRLTVVQGGRA